MRVPLSDKSKRVQLKGVKVEVPAPKPDRTTLETAAMKHRIQEKVSVVMNLDSIPDGGEDLEDADEAIAERLGRLIITQRQLLPTEPEELEAEGEAIYHQRGDADYEVDPKPRKSMKGKGMSKAWGIQPLQFGGRKSHGRLYIPTPLTRRMVKILVACAIPQDVISTILEIDPNTLHKHYQKEIETGAHEINARIGHRLYSFALHGVGKEAITAMMFWLKTRARWRETNTLEHTGPNGEPLEINHVFRTLTHEERAARLLQVLNTGQTKGTGRTVTDGS
jgi:hypothetical protein